MELLRNLFEGYPNPVSYTHLINQIVHIGSRWREFGLQKGVLRI